MKKLLVITIALAMCLAAFAACSNIEASAEENYVAVDMEEAGVQFIVDSNDQVLAFSATTLEGEEVIDQEDYVGEDIEVAIEDAIDNAIELGYVDPEATEEDPNAIVVTTECNNNNFANQWKEQMMNYIDNQMEENGVWAILIGVEDVEEITALATQYNISVARVRIILALQTVDPEVIFESTAEMNNSQIMALIKSLKPLRARVTALETRVAEINAELLTLDEVTDADAILALQTELTEINADLATLDAAKTQMMESKAARRALHQATVNEWRAEKQANSQSIRNRRGSNQYHGYSDQVKQQKKAAAGERICG